MEALHAEFPSITYDATIKIEHLLQHRELLTRSERNRMPVCHQRGGIGGRPVLEKLEKHHTRRDFLEAAAAMRDAGLTLQPTFIAFTPWTTLDGFRDLLQALVDLDLVEHVAPVQLALRLLITSGSRLLELEDVRSVVGPFDSKALVYPWKHPDPAMDVLAQRVFRLVQRHRSKLAPRSSPLSGAWYRTGRLPEDFHRTSDARPFRILTSPGTAARSLPQRSFHDCE